MEKVFYKPWIGKNYETGGNFGKRVMVLGHSHYLENKSDATSNDTIEVVKTFLNPDRDFETWMPTFTKFERAVFNKELNQEEKEQFWQSIVFYNYMQEALSGPRNEFDYELYTKYFDPFIEVLEANQPDIIIVWGNEFFTALPEGNGKAGIPLYIDNIPYNKSWIYILSNGHQVKLYAIKHPSVPSSREDLHKIIKAAIEN